MTTDIHFWEEPLYRLVLQLTVLQIGFLVAVILTIIGVRAFRLHKQRKTKDISSALYTPLMNYLAGDTSLEATYDTLKRYPRRNTCMELENYAIMLGGDALAKIRALYERLNLRNYGIRLSNSLIWWQRLEGIRLLGAAGGHDTVDILLDSLNDGHAIVRLAAARSLGRTKNPKAIEPLLQIMAESKQISQRQIAQTLVAFGPAAYPSLRRIIRQGITETFDHRFIAMALEMLALTGDIESSDPIREALDSTHLEIRIAAYKAAVILHVPLPHSTLKKGLSDPEWPVRAQATLAAGKLTDDSIVPLLAPCLSDSFWWVRNNAGIALSQHGIVGIRELERIRDQSEDRFARDMAARTLTSDPSYHLMQGSDKAPDATPKEAGEDRV